MILYVLVQVLATIVPLLLAVAFLTLVERRVMGAMQRRQGPNVWGFGGLLQPFFDGLKLLLKEPILPSTADQPLFLWAPVLTFLTSQAAWAALPTSHAGAVSDLTLGTMYFLAIGSLGVYGILLAGWASNSKYAFLGCCRSVAQMISYELPMGLIVLTAAVISNSLNWNMLVETQQAIWFFVPLWPLGLIWFICCLAETNRAPFDLPEAEAELVAGYNVEYSSMGFALFFIGEYANLILMSTVTSILFLGGTNAPVALLSFLPGPLWLSLKTLLVLFTFIWVRATLPRYRYDMLMNLGWKVFLPLTLAGFLFNVVLICVFQLVSFPIYWFFLILYLLVFSHFKFSFSLFLVVHSLFIRCSFVVHSLFILHNQEFTTKSSQPKVHNQKFTTNGPWLVLVVQLFIVHNQRVVQCVTIHRLFHL